MTNCLEEISFDFSSLPMEIQYIFIEKLCIGRHVSLDILHCLSNTSHFFYTLIKDIRRRYIYDEVYNHHLKSFILLNYTKSIRDWYGVGKAPSRSLLEKALQQCMAMGLYSSRLMESLLNSDIGFGCLMVESQCEYHYGIFFMLNTVDAGTFLSWKIPKSVNHLFHRGNHEAPSTMKEAFEYFLENNIYDFLASLTRFALPIAISIFYEDHRIEYPIHDIIMKKTISVLICRELPDEEVVNMGSLVWWVIMKNPSITISIQVDTFHYWISQILQSGIWLGSIQIIEAIKRCDEEGIYESLISRDFLDDNRKYIHTGKRMPPLLLSFLKPESLVDKIVSNGLIFAPILYEGECIRKMATKCPEKTNTLLSIYLRNKLEIIEKSMEKYSYAVECMKEFIELCVSLNGYDIIESNRIELIALFSKSIDARYVDITTLKIFEDPCIIFSREYSHNAIQNGLEFARRNIRPFRESIKKKRDDSFLEVFDGFSHRWATIVTSGDINRLATLMDTIEKD